MNIQMLRTWLALVVLNLTLHAQAGSVSLVYSGANPINDAGELSATQGDVLVFDIIWDFSDEPTLGGGFDINFNPMALAFQRFELANICNDPDCYGAWFGFDIEEDRLRDWNYGGFYPIDGVLRMGSVTFEFLGHDHSRPFLYGSPTDGIGGPFVSGTDFITLLEVDFNEIALAPVPLPAAAWLMFCALGMLGAVGRRPAIERR